MYPEGPSTINLPLEAPPVILSRLFDAPGKKEQESALDEKGGSG